MKKLFYFLLYIFLVTLHGLNAQNVLFNNPNEAVNFAVQHSQVYNLQKQRVLLNMKETKFGIQDFLPAFNFSITENDNVMLLAGDTRTKSFQATISQQIFDGGKTKFTYDVNRISSMYAYRDYESSLMDFRSQIISLYYQYLIQKQMILIKEDLVTNAKSQLDIIQKEVETGITLETDYLEYLISYIQIEYDRDQSRRDMNTLERRFKIAIDVNNEAKLTINDDLYYELAYFYYEPFTDFIWTIIKDASTEIKKQNLSLEYAQKQLAFSRRWFVPRIAVQGGISFSGNAYPLTEPKYSFNLIVDFSNAGLFPLSLSNGYGFERNRLYSLTNSASVRLEPQSTYGVQKKLADISLLETNMQRIKTEREIHETVFNLIISHDNSLRSADATERTISVLGRRLEFSRLEVEQGEKKHIDYLKELITMAQTKISLLEYQTQAASIERSLEILAGFPFGGLQNACKQQKI
jgi:outer membrane protein TolC